MSPSTSVCRTVTQAERDLVGKAVPLMKDAGFQFGVRKQENGSGSPLKVSKDSHRIRKPPLPLPQVQYRPPIIIHTYSPKVIHTQPDDFMSLVQKLTGSSDTRLRLKKSPKKEKSADRKDQTPASNSGVQAAAALILERQGSGSSSTTNCGSPSLSVDSAFLVTDSCDGEATINQSNSPRSPLDSPFEFDNDLMFTQFEYPSTPGSSMFNSHSVKAEPMLSFPGDNHFNSFVDLIAPQKSSPRPQMQQEADNPYANIDINPPVSSLGFLPPNLMPSLPDFSPNTSAWSQSFLDFPSSPAPSGHFGLQAPYQRQRPLQQFSAGYSLPMEGNMVALENIQAFMMT
ncbi:uncharacterized protein [Physcomitrium patens]|uniref:VQ domain-containing protein n=1 Tax=Physcomitrium patens TaxID=3218 RepID=A0A2K1KKX4_PHYPA|nr:uncharacterized protein LOC112283017 [Physcomitrium patens]PNR54426.1 hypothetical protein PHYPA_008103 [Physcomitrium patens]|eukprot:XP_024377081.1 uncharacterized protein LOC112283017 [Physcomitrella patens]